MQRKLIAGGTHLEEVFNFSNAVRVGSSVFISGTTALKDGVIVHPNNPYKQTVYILNEIKTVLAAAGAKLENVVRITIYCANIDDWRDIAKAHKEVLGETGPALTMVEVSRLFLDALVQIEVDAIIVPD
jgi:enamine deaminase RidA (YjgF/YER057c/UK114 family)